MAMASSLRVGQLNYSITLALVVAAILTQPALFISTGTAYTAWIVKLSPREAAAG